MDYDRTKEYLNQIGQIQLLDYYNELDEDKRRILLAEIEKTDFSVIDDIRKAEIKSLGEISPVPVVGIADIAENREKFYNYGLDIIRNKKVGAVLLAGGQGSRLGLEKPKGMFDLGETRNLTIFEQLISNLKAVTSAAGVWIPLFIMTSENNYAETIAFFTKNDFFGYPENSIYFYKQKTEPACDFEGKVFLDEKHRVSFSPNGNGGWYSSLKDSYSDILAKEGIEWLNVFGIDNVLQKICDPLFIGATVLSGCACGAKVVKKTCAEERVGVLCTQNSKPSVIEYYDMPKELSEMRGGDGELVFRYGVILNYLFNVSRLDKIIYEKLPYHLAKKAIPHMKDGVRVVPAAPNGYKFETLVVDMISSMGSCLAFEVEREKEFAPLKNRYGVDSVETARNLLKKNGIKL